MSPLSVGRAYDMDDGTSSVSGIYLGGRRDLCMDVFLTNRAL